MDIRFDHEIALVTGAASGIGFACAQMLAESGAEVVMLGRSEAKLKDAAALLKTAGTVHAYELDITCRDAVPDVIRRIRQEVGEIGVLIQAAGRGFRGEDIFSLGTWDRAMEVNATGSFQVMGEVASQSMIPRKAGSIVNIASMAGMRGMMPPMSDFGYSASKAALISLTREGAVMLAEYGIRVNAIAPGGVASGGVGMSSRPVRKPDDPSLPYVDIIPSGRHSTPYEIASSACFMASEWAGNITGQVLTVDGGASVMGF